MTATTMPTISMWSNLVGFHGIRNHSVGSADISVPSSRLMQPAHCFKVGPVQNIFHHKSRGDWTFHGSQPWVSNGSGNMVGDRAHFHFLQLHHWPAVLNCSHNYHIAEDDQIKSLGWWKGRMKWEFLTGSSQFWPASPHWPITISAFGTPTTNIHYD